MTTDMTVGSPGKILWKFSIPLLVSILFQQLYSIADSIIAGKYINVDALAAVGASYPITMIFMAVAAGCNIGCSVVIGQLFGSRDHGGMKTAISTSIITVMAVSVVLTVVGLISCEPLLRLLDTPANIFDSSALFLRIYIFGLAFLFLYNICTGVFTALGDSRTPLYFLIASSVANICTAFFFVAKLNMGIAGVAWATFLCQGIAAILLRLRKIPTDGKYPRFSLFMLSRISAISIPSILQQSFVSIGNLFVQGLVNSFGSDVVAGYSAAIKLNTFAVMGFTTLATGVSTFTAQNLGAGKHKRIPQGFRSGCIMAACVVIPFFIAFFFFGEQSMSIFMNNDGGSAAIAAGCSFLTIVSPFFFVVALKLIADSVLRGAGSMRPFMITTFADLIIRVALSFVFSHFWGSVGIWLSWPVGWSIGCALSLIFYYSGVWKKEPLS
ncbi:MAG: MATE family efflux transporter [Clostridia bacterium]